MAVGFHLFAPILQNFPRLSGFFVVTLASQGCQITRGGGVAHARVFSPLWSGHFLRWILTLFQSSEKKVTSRLFSPGSFIPYTTNVSIFFLYPLKDYFLLSRSTSFMEGKPKKVPHHSECSTCGSASPAWYRAKWHYSVLNVQLPAEPGGIHSKLVASRCSIIFSCSAREIREGGGG